MALTEQALKLYNDAEQSVLGALIADAPMNAADVFRQVRSEDFLNGERRYIFDTCRAMFARNDQIDPYTVRAACGTEYIELVKDLCDMMMTPSNCAAYVVPVASAFKDAATEAFSWAQENVLPKAEALLGKLAGAFEWVAQNMDKVGPVLEGLVKLWGVSKIAKFGTDAVGAASDLWEFGRTVKRIGGTELPKKLGSFKNGVGKVFDGLATGADKAGTGIVKLGGGFKTALGKLGGFVGTAFKFVAANPIVLGIAAAIAAGVLIWQNWDTIKQYAGQLWEKVKDVFGKIGSWISEKFNGVKDAASGLWTSIKETFGGIKDSIVGAFEGAKEKVSGFFSWLDQEIESKPIIGQLYKGGKWLIGGAVDLLAGNALGTSYWRGGLTRVNERGGEIMNLPSGTQIIPHDISARMAGGPRVTVNVTVAGNVIGNEQYADELGERIADKLLRAIENM